MPRVDRVEGECRALLTEEIKISLTLEPCLPCPALRCLPCLALTRRTWPGFALSTSGLDSGLWTSSFCLCCRAFMFVVQHSITHALHPSRTLACCCVPPLPHVKSPCSPFPSPSGSWTRPGYPGGCSCVKGPLHKRRPLISVSSNQWSRAAGSARSKQLGSPEHDLRCCVCCRRSNARDQ
jgi:hypothetical protein